jgi:aryl-alcohol dehydrogenase-like predicted oxidoreductase
MSTPATVPHVPAGQIEFGLGLLTIGKSWGARPRPVPSQVEATALLDEALRLGVRVFDTAASYGDGEAKFGCWLSALDSSARADLFVATKFGEHWDAAKNEPFDDHSRDALILSLERSLSRLGRIDLLQVHKTTPQVLESSALDDALAAARRAGITLFGASVREEVSARIAITDPRFSQIQVPYNRGNPSFAEVIGEATSNGKLVWTNRPLMMGSLVSADAAQAELTGCFGFVVAKRFTGAVLCGTASANHLRANLMAFRQAVNACPNPSI